MDIPISQNEQLQPGDVVKLYFRRRGVLIIKDALGALVEKALRNNPRYELLSWDLSDPEIAIYTVRIKAPAAEGQVQQASVLSILAVIGITGLGALAFGWMFVKAEKVIEKSIPLVVVVLGILLWLRAKR